MKKIESTRITKRCIPGVTLQPRDGYYQVHHIGLTAKRVKWDPAFSNTRQEARQFALLSTMAGLIHKALLPGTGIKKMMPRLMAILHKSVDTGKAPWCHSPANIHWHRLKGFECNKERPLSETINAGLTARWEEKQDDFTIHFPVFNPLRSIKPPRGIAHARIIMISVVIDVTTKEVAVTKSRTTLIPIRSLNITLRPLTVPVTVQAHRIFILALAVEWYGKHNPNGPLIRSDHPASMAIIKAGYYEDG